MVEAGADEVPEEVMLEAIMFGHEQIKKLIAFQEEIVAAVGKEKSKKLSFTLLMLTLSIKYVKLQKVT